MALFGSSKKAKSVTPVTKVSKQDTPLSAAQRDVVEVTASQEALAAALATVIVEGPVEYEFDGSISREHLDNFWTWVGRDVDAKIPKKLEALLDDGESPSSAIEKVLPTLNSSVEAILAEAKTDIELDRRITVQIGGEEIRERLPIILRALRSLNVIKKAKAFGTATNTIQDENALGLALQSMPIKDPALASLLMHAVVGQSENPSKLISAVVTLVGRTTESTIKNAGFAPFVDAVLAHAQNQLAIISSNSGSFGDVDLICKCIVRYHKLMRALSIYVELERNSRWSLVVSHLTTGVSFQIEPRLREVSGDVSQSLRKAREGKDRVNSERLLAALNGVYLMGCVRDVRDSLAINTLVDKVWNETGQALEILLTRNLEDYRANPSDTVSGERLDYGIKMAELRFNAEYADILRKAKDSVNSRRAAS